MSTSYFNETGPIYREERIQAKEFVKFVRHHVVVNGSSDGNTGPEKETVRFDWDAFRIAIASLQASDLSPEIDLIANTPPARTPMTTTDNAVPDTTIKMILDGLVDRFSSTFTSAFFISTAINGADEDKGDQAYFFDTLRNNLYRAFTHHLDANDAPEQCLSFRALDVLDANARPRSAWEYRLLFVHSATSKAVRGLVMTVTLEGSIGDGHNGEEAWYGVSLDARGPFSGALKAMQVIVGEGFRCP